jgi:hypothetical protein
MKKLNKFFLADLHTKGKQEGYIEGIASTWNKDLGGDKIEQGAFSETIPNFMKNPVMLFSHQLDKPIGKWTNLVETGNGLEVTGQINTNTAMGKEVHQLIKDNDVKGLSIGYSVDDSEAIGETNVLKKLSLWEISIVAIPMNQQAWIAGAKMFDGNGGLITKFDSKAGWQDVAVAMYLLKTGKFQYKDIDGQQAERELEYISKWYEKLNKKLPKTEDGKTEFAEDEQYQYEVSRFKSNIISITDIVKHWQKAGRELPEGDLPELYKTLAGRFNSIGKELEAAQLKKVQSIERLSVKVNSLIENVASQKKAEAQRKEKMLNQVDTIIKEALFKATGKRF